MPLLPTLRQVLWLKEIAVSLKWLFYAKADLPGAVLAVKGISIRQAKVRVSKTLRFYIYIYGLKAKRS